MSTNPGTRNDPNKHQCAANGCQKMLPHRMLMCPADWRRVPYELQQRVLRAYRKKDAAGRAQLTDAYVTAVTDAVEAVRVAREKERAGVPPRLAPGW